MWYIVCILYILLQPSNYITSIWFKWKMQSHWLKCLQGRRVIIEKRDSVQLSCIKEGCQMQNITLWHYLICDRDSRCYRGRMGSKLMHNPVSRRFSVVYLPYGMWLALPSKHTGHRADHLVLGDKMIKPITELETNNRKWTLVLVMICYRCAKNHYQSQSWPRTMWPYCYLLKWWRKCIYAYRNRTKLADVIS